MGHYLPVSPIAHGLFLPVLVSPIVQFSHVKILQLAERVGNMAKIIERIKGISSQALEEWVNKMCEERPWHKDIARVVQASHDQDGIQFQYYMAHLKDGTEVPLFVVKLDLVNDVMEVADPFSIPQ